jgi:hypothetical protein
MPISNIDKQIRYSNARNQQKGKKDRDRIHVLKAGGFKES